MPRLKQFDVNEVLDKAVDLFWKQGYHATSMQDLIDGLGINRASLYDTFGSKLELFNAALSRYSQQQLQWWSETLYYETIVRQGIFKVLNHQFDLKPQGELMASGCFVVNSICEMYQKEESSRQIIQHHQDKQLEMLMNYFQYGINQGQISPYKSIKELSFLMLDILYGLSISSRLNPEPDYFKKQSNKVLSLLD